MPLLINPETIIFDNDGTMYIINEDAKLVSLHDFQPLVEEDTSILTATAIEVADLGHGRPLGGKFDNDGCLYFADVIFGLNKICNISSEQGIIPSSSVEVVASQVKLDDGTFSPINYADDVDIGPRTGHVYFSDASNIKPDRNIHGQWDILYASKIEALRGNLTGRLLRFIPETGALSQVWHLPMVWRWMSMKHLFFTHRHLMQALGSIIWMDQEKNGYKVFSQV